MLTSTLLYTFATQNQIGKAAEQAFETLLTAVGIPFDRNPFTGTDDPRRADYDCSIGNLLIEVKSNPKAAETGNIVLEEDILDVSKAHYFLLAFPVTEGWHGRILHRDDISKLLNATTSTFVGRVYKYKRVPAGEFKQFSALVPVTDLLRVGLPVDQFINSLKK